MEWGMRCSQSSGKRRGTRALALRAFASALLLAAIVRPAGAAQTDYANFDHQTTGFPLDGQHLNLRCEQCHLRGIFTGTSKLCLGCHIQGNPLSAVFMPANHIPTPEPCDTCHTTNTFQGTHFAHASVMPGTCAQCHNNVNATGKSAKHLPTTAACDQCHTTVSFTSSFATFPSGHIPTSQACNVCHDPAKFVPGMMNHAGISGGCTVCHAADAPGIAPLVFTIKYANSGAPAVTLTPTSQNYHPPTSALPQHFPISFSCEQCHRTPTTTMPATAAAGGFGGGTMNHKGITSGCEKCHADGLGPFIGVAALVTASSNGPHIPINGTACELCHKSTTVPGGFAGTAMVHTGLNGLSTCGNCHENNPNNQAYYGLTTKLVLRPPTLGAPPNAVTPLDANHPTGGDCSQCHASTTSFTTNIAEPSNHIPIGKTGCTNCHQGTTAPFLPANTVMNHSGFTSTCAGCHGAGKNFYGTAQSEAGGQPLQPPGAIGTSGAANHIPYGSTDCVGCHSASSTSQGGFKLTTTPALSATGHTAVNALTCETCHASAMAWYGVTVVVPPGAVGTAGSANHIALGTGGCSTCHATNIAVGGFKITTTPSLAGAGHTAVASQSCDSCHAAANATWYGVMATAPATNHIPTASAVCSGCHASNFVTGGFKITSSPVLSVAGHTVVSSVTCNTCHENNATDLGFQGVLTQIYLRPGNAAAGLSKVDAAHATGTLATADCAGCHTTTPPFQGSSSNLPSNHIPLPSSGAGATCTTCHSAGFTPALSTMNHASVASESCSACHGAGKGPFAGSGPGRGGQPVAPPGTLGASGAGNHIPVSSADCVGCHAATDAETGTGFKLTSSPLLSSTGHTAVNALTCQSCHASGMAWYGVTTVVPPGTVGTSGAANHIATGTGDCSTCHGSTIAVGAFKIGATPSLGTAGHQVVSSVSCASCHGAGSAWYGVPSLVMPLSNHIPMASAACSACHASNFVTGGFKIATSPVLSVAGHTAVSSLTCASCHANNATDLGFQGVLTQIYLRPGAAVAGLSTIDLAHATGNLLTGDCGQCHNTTPPFTGNNLPNNHMPLPSSGAGATCATCHSAGFSPSLSKMVHSAVTLESCTTCHGSGKGPFAGSGPGTGGQPVQPPGTLGTSGSGNHIPVSSADCVGCHASTDTESGTGFKLATSPLLSTSGHTAVNALTCQTCHSSGMAWYGVTIVAPPGTVGTSGSVNHIALGTGGCSTCHATNIAVGGFKITTAPSLAAMGHAAVSSLSCASCHGTGSAWYGVPSLVAQLSSHIPIAGAVCTACHASNFVTGGFKIASSPTLSVAGHAVVSSVTCVSCHDNNATDLGFQGVLTQIYLRPGTAVAGLSPIDNAHATGTLATADCSQCHTTAPPFTGNQMPGNHMPLPATGAPACAVCHAAGYGVGKSIMVHSSVASETCSTCHGPGKGPFSGTSQGTGGQPKQQPGTVGTPGAGNHIPIASAQCNACHATADAMTGTGFHISTTPALSATGHTAVVSLTCQTCHNSGMAWFGVTIKTPPGTVGTSGAGNHIPIPSGDNCNTCHANTNYVSFAGTTMNHAGISSGCASCHNGGMAWYGVTIKTSTLTPAHIPVAATSVCEACHSATNFTAFGPGTAMTPTSHLQVPTSLEACTTCHENGDAAKFYGVTIVTRPTATQDPSHPPAPQDCGNSGCHTTAPPFQGGVKPSNHIASSATCTNCHTGYTPATTTMNHADSGVGLAGTPVACATCHGYGAGPYYGTAQGQAGGQPLQPPGTNGGPASASQHLPFGTAACSICHKSTIVPGGFKGTTVPHTNGPFMTYTRGSGKSNTGTSTPKCNTCHAPSGAKWYGTSFSTKTEGQHASSTATADCVDCHSPTGGFAAAAAAAARAKPRPTTGVPVRPAGRPSVSGPNPRATAGTNPSTTLLAGTGPFSHLGVAPGSCTSCHRPGGGASAMPGGHLATTLSCNACHRTTAWLPVTYMHAGVGPGHCASCHAANGKWATPKPAAHFVTARSCDVCHHNTGTWLPVMYDHLSPRYRPQTGAVRCVDCHTTNTEMVVRGLVKPARRALPGGAVRP
jgi:hypothetical protein